MEASVPAQTNAFLLYNNMGISYSKSMLEVVRRKEAQVASNCEEQQYEQWMELSCELNEQI